jgi:osmotically inducible protein OsmC
MITRRAQATWNGDLKKGRGTLRFKGYEGTYSFASRFERGEGTNPEALIGAAHAGCFSMALALVLEKAGSAPRSIETTADVHLDPKALRIARVDLHTSVDVPGMDAATVKRCVEEAKQSCPVSKALAGVEITADVELAPSSTTRETSAGPI